MIEICSLISVYVVNFILFTFTVALCLHVYVRPLKPYSPPPITLFTLHTTPAITLYATPLHPPLACRHAHISLQFTSLIIRNVIVALLLLIPTSLFTSLPLYLFLLLSPLLSPFISPFLSPSLSLPLSLWTTVFYFYIDRWSFTFRPVDSIDYIVKMIQCYFQTRFTEYLDLTL